MKSEKRVLFLLAASVVVILLVTVLTLFSGEEQPGTKKPSKKPKTTAEPIAAEHNKLMMVKSVDAEAGTIVLYDLEAGGEVTISYGVAADIRSKYGSLTYATSLEYGQIVRAEYDGEGRLVKMQLSGEHWELHGIEEFSIGEEYLTVNNTNYKITGETVAYCEGEKIAIGEVRDIDRVELCGINSELLTIRVVKGHGSIKLINCEEFQEAKVTFKDESHVLTGEPTYLVREGKYTVTVTGEKKAAAAEVTVARNEQVVIDLYEYGGAPAETAEVRFKVTPFSSILKIDGERVDYYEQDLTLEYGEHEVIAELGGYVTYKGILTISRPCHTFQIDLPERPVTEDGTGETSGEGSGDNSDGGASDGTEGGSGETTDRRYVPIGAELGHEYDASYSTLLLEPTGAIVEIDGFSIGTVPVEFEKILGTYTITLRKNGKEKEYKVTVDNESFPEEDVIWKFSMN